MNDVKTQIDALLSIEYYGENYASMNSHDFLILPCPRILVVFQLNMHPVSSSITEDNE